MTNYRGFGQAVPPTCQDKQAALVQAQQGYNAANAQYMQSVAVSPPGDPNLQAAMAQAAQGIAQAQHDLNACVAHPPLTGAQQFQQGAQAAGSVIAPLASIGTGLFAALSGKAPPPRPGAPVIVTPAGGSNTTLIVVGVAAVVVILLVVILMKK